LITQQTSRNGWFVFLVDYGEKLSNFFEDVKKVDDFAQYIENQGK